MLVLPVSFKLVSREQYSFNLSAAEVIGSHSKSLLSRWHYILSVMHHALSHYKRHQEFCETQLDVPVNWRVL